MFRGNYKLPPPYSAVFWGMVKYGEIPFEKMAFLGESFDGCPLRSLGQTYLSFVSIQFHRGAEY